PSPSCIVDLKAEIAKAVYRWRRERFGKNAIFIDPYNMLGLKDPYHFNPLADIDPDDPLAADELRDLANAIVVRSGKEPDPYWLDQSENAIFAMMAAATTLYEPGLRTLPNVQELLADADARAGAIAQMIESSAWGGVVKRVAFQQRELKDREAASVFSSALRHL